MKVILHGDDFGLTSGVNSGIARSFRHGLLSSTSILVNGEAAEEAISFAKKNPDLDVGIHLVLCDEPPLLPPERLPSIMSKDGLFPSRRKILAAVLSGRIDYAQVEVEWRAQIEKILDAGVPISHMDGHQFVHLFPGLFSVCLKLGVKYQIPYVRTLLLEAINLDVDTKRLFQWFLLRSWATSFIAPRLPSEIRAIPATGFLKAGGGVDRALIGKWIDQFRRNTDFPIFEIMLHPGIGDPHTGRKYRHWRYDWKRDMDLLLDPSLKDLLDRQGVQITSFRERL